MRQRNFRWYSAIQVFACSVFLSPFVQAADFVVLNRNDVLVIASKIQATQFLTHATFGPTEAEIESLAAEMRQKGTIQAASDWIDVQTDTLQTPFETHSAQIPPLQNVDFQFCTFTLNGVPTGIPPDSSNSPRVSRYRQFVWWKNAIVGQAQLRQRMAWALSQICAVGTSNAAAQTVYNTTVVNGPVNSARYLGITDYYDIFVRNAFSTYRRVIGEVTYHPVMGDWLSFRGNRRAQSGSAPDENYAREVMQLFTIGLDLLADNGEKQSDALGVIPTYDADDIREYAQVFTGLGYGYGTLVTTSTSYSPYTGVQSNNPNSSSKLTVPMRMSPAQHDRSTKNLLNGLNLSNPSGEGAPFPSSDLGENQANADIGQALDGLIAHPSCPPFIVHRLIQRFVKSNPSKAYIDRVVQVFKNDGSGVRGDLKAVIKAILLDPEAWQPIRVQYQRVPSSRFVVSTMGTEDSRLQEPVLSYTRFIRNFKPVANYEKAVGGSYANPILINNEFRLGDRTNEFAQSPYTSPTVFNFYSADYQPRPIASIPVSSRIPNATLFAPEFEIVNAITSNRTVNWFRDRIVVANHTQPHLQVNDTSTSQASNIVTTQTEATRCRVVLDFSVEQSLSFTPTGIDRLLERLDLQLCGGTLHDAYKAKLRQELLREFDLAGGLGSISTTEALNIAKSAIFAIVTAPSYLVTE